MVKVMLDRDDCISCGACKESVPIFRAEPKRQLSQIVEKYRSRNWGKGEALDKPNRLRDNSIF